MKLPRDISGRRLVQALCRQWGYRQVHQTGSHIILETDEPSRHRLSIPDHKTLRIGTLNAALRAVASHKGTTKDRILGSL